MESLFSFRHWLSQVLIFVLLAVGTASAQAPAWQWALLGPGPVAAESGALALATAVNARGDVFVTGFFSGTIRLGHTVLVSAGRQDMFVAKWDAATTAWAWATSGGGSGFDQGQGIAVSGANVYVTGYFADEGTVAISGRKLMGLGKNDIYLAKYTDAGNSFHTGWITVEGGPEYDEGHAVAVEGNKLYVTGMFKAKSKARIAGVVLTGNDSQDVFVAAYTDEGTRLTPRWAVSGGGPGNDYGYGIAVSDNQVFVTGGFGNISILDPTATFAGTGLHDIDRGDMFLAKYFDAGTHAINGWATSGGGGSVDNGLAVAVQGPNVYVTGVFGSKFDAHFAGTALTGAGDFDMFVAKYTDQGFSVANGWATSGGGANSDSGTALAVQGADVYVSGRVQTAPSVQVGGTLLTHTGRRWAFVAKYHDLGSHFANAWVASTSSSTVNGLALFKSTLSVVGAASVATGFGTPGKETAAAAGLFAQLVESLAPVRPASIPAVALVAVGNKLAKPTFFSPTQPMQAVATAATLYNALGQVVRTIATPTAETVVDVRGLPAGIYSLRLLVEGVPVARCVVVE